MELWAVCSLMLVLHELDIPFDIIVDEWDGG